MSHTRGISSKVRGLIIHHVAEPLYTATAKALNQITKLYKNNEGITEPNSIAELLITTIPCHFTVTHTHYGENKPLYGSLTWTSTFVCELLSISSLKDVLSNISVVKTVLLQSTISRTENIILTVGHNANTLFASGTFTCIIHSSRDLPVLIVLCEEKHVYIVDVKTKVSGSKEDRVHNFEPHT